MLQLPIETLLLNPAYSIYDSTTLYGTVSYVTVGMAPALPTTADETLVIDTVSIRRTAQNLLYNIIYELFGNMTPEHNLH